MGWLSNAWNRVKTIAKRAVTFGTRLAISAAVGGAAYLAITGIGPVVASFFGITMLAALPVIGAVFVGSHVLHWQVSRSGRTEARRLSQQALDDANHRVAAAQRDGAATDAQRVEQQANQNAREAENTSLRRDIAALQEQLASQTTLHAQQRTADHIRLQSMETRLAQLERERGQGPAAAAAGEAGAPPPIAPPVPADQPAAGAGAPGIVGVRQRRPPAR